MFGVFIIISADSSCLINASGFFVTRTQNDFQFSLSSLQNVLFYVEESCSSFGK
jgi:hypothetical protein